MTDTVSTVLRKWGNSQGFILPSSMCKEANLKVGDSFVIEIDDSGRIIINRLQEKTYSRSEVLTLEEFVGNWAGDKVGEEWSGLDVGAEVVA